MESWNKPVINDFVNEIYKIINMNDNEQTLSSFALYAICTPSTRFFSKSLNFLQFNFTELLVVDVNCISGSTMISGGRVVVGIAAKHKIR